MICDAGFATEPPADRPAATTDAVRVAVDFGLPLTREAVGALVSRDLRFVLVEPQTSTADRGVVALIDATHAHGARRPLLSSASIAGYVLLSRQPLSVGIGRDAFGNLAKLELPFTASWQQVAEALMRVAAEVDATVVQRTLPRTASWRQQHATLDSLTPRERDVLRLIAAGMNVREMARSLHLADSTVDNHRARLMKKLKVHKAVDAARFAYRIGLVAP